MESKYAYASLATVTVSLASPAVLLAHEGDIAPSIDNGRLVTRLGDDSSGTVGDIWRVFAAEFLDPATFPTPPLVAESTDDPGHLIAPGTFPATSVYGFNVRGAFRRWNPSLGADGGFEVTSSTLVLSSAGQPAINVPSSGTAITPGYSLVIADADEEIDWHTFFNLIGPGGLSEAPDGIWLLEMESYVDLPDLSRLVSDPYWIVFNSGGEAFEEDHEAAIEWVERNLVPTPGAACLLVLAGISVSRRRR